MRLLNVKTAKSIWLIDLNDLNPTGRNVADDLILWIKDRYSFDRHSFTDPTDPKGGSNAPADFHGVKFTAGKFDPSNPDGLIEARIIVNLEVYNDGLVAETFSSTRNSDRFLQDLLSAASESMRISFDESLIRQKFYVSELHVKSDASLEMLNPRLKPFADKLSKNVTRRGPFQAASIGFWTDPGRNGGHITFSLERQAGKDFTQNRYFSSAPMPTDLHFEFLEELEDILLKPS
jgi:hypothetical protein